MPFIHAPVGYPTAKRDGHAPDHTTISCLIFVAFLISHLMQLFHVCFIDRGKLRKSTLSRLRIQSWIRDRINATIQDLDQEADRLADRLVEYMKDRSGTLRFGC